MVVSRKLLTGIVKNSRRSFELQRLAPGPRALLAHLEPRKLSTFISSSTPELALEALGQVGRGLKGGGLGGGGVPFADEDFFI